MIATIHQPHFLPWLGYYNKLANSNILIVQDNVQFRKDFYQNRTVIRDHNNYTSWLTIPVFHHLNLQIKDIQVCNFNWRKKIILTIYHKYHNSPYFNLYYQQIKDIILKSDDSLLSLNLELLKYTMSLLDIAIPIKLGSTFEKQNSSTEDIIYVCKCAGINEIIFGEGGGLIYHGINIFKSNNLKIRKQAFRQKFNQLTSGYSDGHDDLSIIDYLFNMPIDQVISIVKQTWTI